MIYSYDELNEIVKMLNSHDHEICNLAISYIDRGEFDLTAREDMALRILKQHTEGGRISLMEHMLASKEIMHLLQKNLIQLEDKNNFHYDY